MSTIHYQSSQSMFRNSPIGFIICLMLCVTGAGFVLLLLWWLMAKATTLTVDDDKTTLRRGLLSKHTNEVFHVDVRNIKVSQSFFNRIFDVGTIFISSAGQANEEIVVRGMPTPEKIKEIINSLRKTEKAAPAAAPAQSSDIDQLEKLAKLRDEGILTEEEFTQKKAQLLA